MPDTRFPHRDFPPVSTDHRPGSVNRQARSSSPHHCLRRTAIQVTWSLSLTVGAAFFLSREHSQPGVLPNQGMSCFTTRLLGTVQDFQSITPVVDSLPVTHPSPKGRGKAFKRTRSRTFPTRLISRHNPVHFLSWTVARFQSVVPRRVSSFPTQFRFRRRSADRLS